MNQTTTVAIERGPKAALVPLFVILLTICFALLSTVALEHGRHSQRSLTRPFEGRVDHSGLGSQMVASSAGGVAPADQVQARELSPHSSPSTQVPAVKVKPPVTVKPGRRARRGHEPFPASPPAELNDPSDMRRVSFSI